MKLVLLFSLTIAKLHSRLRTTIIFTLSLLSMATNSATSLHYHPYPFPYLRNLPLSQLQLNHRHHHYPTTTPLSRSFSPRPGRRRRPTRRNKRNSNSSSSDLSSRLQFVLDVEELKTRTPLPLQTTLHYCRSKFNQFLSSSIDAYNDLSTLVIVDPGTNRVVVSCSQSTVRFVGGLLVLSCVALVLVKLGLGFLRRSEGVSMEVVTRRDRSLGGREVVVQRRVVKGGERKSGDVVGVDNVQAMPRLSSRRDQRKLPKWWPVVCPRTIVDVNREEYRRAANQLVQG